MKPTRVAVQSSLLALLAAMLAVACLPAVPNGPPRTAAFWYLWYPQTPTGHYTPLLQPYNSSLPKVVKQEVNEMQYAGIQIGIISWFGPGTQSEATRLPLALRAADGTHFRETLYYEPEGHGNPTSAKIESDLAYIEAHYSRDRNYLRIGGKPVLFVWGDGGDNCSTLALGRGTPHRALLGRPEGVPRLHHLCAPAARLAPVRAHVACHLAGQVQLLDQPGLLALHRVLAPAGAQPVPLDHRPEGDEGVTRPLAPDHHVQRDG